MDSNFQERYRFWPGTVLGKPTLEEKTSQIHTQQSILKKSESSTKDSFYATVSKKHYDEFVYSGLMSMKKSFVGESNGRYKFIMKTSQGEVITVTPKDGIIDSEDIAIGSRRLSPESKDKLKTLTLR